MLHWYPESDVTAICTRRYYWDPKLDGDHGDCCIRQVSTIVPSRSLSLAGVTTLRLHKIPKWMTSNDGQREWTSRQLAASIPFQLTSMDAYISMYLSVMFRWSLSITWAYCNQTCAQIEGTTNFFLRICLCSCVLIQRVAAPPCLK